MTTDDILTVHRKPARSNGKHPGGRPALAWSPALLEAVEQLAEISCTREEIANILKVSLEAITDDKEFMEHYEKGFTEGNKSLRRRQFDLCFSKNEAVAGIQLIWQGKQRLGQSDKREDTVRGEVRQSYIFVLPGGERVATARTVEETPRIIESSARTLPAADDDKIT